MADSKQLNEKFIEDIKEIDAADRRTFDEDFKDKCKNAIKELLRSISKGLSEEEMDANAEFHLTGEGEELDSRQPDQPESEQQLKAVKNVHDIYHAVNTVYGKAYLFLNAPYEVAKRYEEEDREANKAQNEKMYRTLQDTDEKRRQNPMKEQVVRTETEIEDALMMFFNSYLMHTKEITIVFNGEGHSGNNMYPKGSLCLADNQPLPMSDFLSRVVHIWIQVVKEKAIELSTADLTPATVGPNPSVMIGPKDETAAQPMETEDKQDYSTIMDKIPPIPSSVLIIFGHCYSFAGAEDPIVSEWGSKFENVTLTAHGVRGGLAFCKYRYMWNGVPAERRIEGVIRYLAGSTHREFQNCAEQLKDGVPHGELQVRRK